MIDERDKERLHDWIDGRLPEREAEAFARRVLAEPELAREHAEISRLVAQLATLRAERAPEGFAEAVARAAAGHAPGGPAHGPRRPFLWLGAVASLAAALTIAAVYLGVSRGERSFGSAPGVERAVLPPDPRTEQSAGDERRDSESEDPRDAALPPRAAAGSAEAGPEPAGPAAPKTETRLRGGAGKKPGSDADATAGEADDRAESKRRADESSVGFGGDARNSEPEGSALAGEEVVPVVWRIRLPAPSAEAADSGRGEDDRAGLANDTLPLDSRPGPEVLRELRDAIEAIRDRAPRRVVELDSVEAARAEFVAKAGEAGWIVEELGLAPSVAAAASDAVDAPERKESAARSSDPVADALAALSRVGRWNRVTLAADPVTTGTGGTPIRAPQVVPPPGDAAPAGAPGRSTEASRRLEDTAKKAKDESRPRPAAGERVGAAPLGAALESAPRVIVIYEFDPPR